MEYMRGLLRDNDLFRTYITVRAGGARRGARALRNGLPWAARAGGHGGGRGLGPVAGPTLSPAPPPRCSGPRSTSSASG